MATFPAPTAPPLTRRHRALLAAVAAGRCHLTPGRLPNLLIDRRGACDQLAAHQLLANGLIQPTGQQVGGLVTAELTASGRRAAGCTAQGR